MEVGKIGICTLGWMKKIGIDQRKINSKLVVIKEKLILSQNLDNQGEKLSGWKKKIENLKSGNRCGEWVKKLVTEKNFNWKIIVKNEL